ncbi:MAG: S-layer homology domain-containing protein [Bacillota bacterium]
MNVNVDATTGTGIQLPSSTQGTVEIPTGATGITLSNTTAIDFTLGVQTAVNNTVNVGGNNLDLGSFTSGNLTNANLTEPKTIGDKSVTVNKAVKLESGVNQQPISIINSNLPTAELQIPDATTILAPDSWDGKILPPKAGQSNPADSAPSGFRIGGTVIEVGAPNAVLLFDQPVTIFLKGVTGNMAYRPADSSQWVKINQAGGTYDNPTPPPAFGEAYISNGVDTKIITWHLTAFAVLTPISSGGGGGGGGSTFTGTTVTTSGGTVTGSGAAIEIPANAMNSSFKVKIEKVSNTSSLPMAENLVSDVLEITKDKSGNFDKPVTITVPYDKNKVDLSKQKISLYWLDGQIWRELDNIQIDEVNGKISGEVNHFTKFAVLATDIDKAAFTDIAGHWAAANIEALVNAGVITGYPDGTFKPNNTITRAEFATAVVKAFNLELKSGKVFNDTANHWAEDFIATAAANGLISGYNDTTFGPNDLITREQMAVLIVNATGLTEVSSAKTFADGASISDWAKDGVAIASGNDLITGYPDNTFKPKGNATRAEAVTILINALTLE